MLLVLELNLDRKVLHIKWLKNGRKSSTLVAILEMNCHEQRRLGQNRWMYPDGDSEIGL
jgi:hypothetical protein